MSAVPAARRLSRIAAVLLVFAALVPLEASPNPGLAAALANAVHFPLFALFTTLVYYGLPGSSPLRGTPRLVRAGLISGTAAISIEAVQGLVGRTPSVLDLAIGAGGIGAALLAIRLSHGGHAAWVRLGGLAAAALAVFGALLIPAWFEWRAAAWRRVHFPLLGDFEDELELQLWRSRRGREIASSALEPTSERVTSGRRALRIETAAGSWAGADYAAGGLDWRGYAELAWDVFNPGEPFWMGLRVEKGRTYESAFSTGFDVERGWNHFRVPLERDLSAISAIMFFTGENQPGRVFHLDHVRLEGQGASSR